MKPLLTILLLLASAGISFSQWTRVQQLPSSSIQSLYSKDGIIYAGGRNVVYFSADRGQSWDSTSTLPQFISVDNIIVYRGELFAASFSVGVFKSSDGGVTWQDVNAGIPPFISDFAEWRGNLYASTLGSSVFKFDSINLNRWNAFNRGLSDLSLNGNSIGGNNNSLICGTRTNGLYDYLPADSTVWEERFLNGAITPTEGVHDIITAHDTLFLSGFTGRFYLSTDNGLSWTRFGDRLTTLFTTIVNAKEAILAARDIIDGQGILNTNYYYIKKDSLDQQFVPFSFVPNSFSFRLEIFDNKLWDATTNGLFYLSLSALPGITAADSILSAPLPLQFVSFNVHLKSNKTVLIEWETVDQVNVSHFELERSIDGQNWVRLANTAINPSQKYQYIDSFPQPGRNYYRIKAVDIDGRLTYTNIDSVSLTPVSTIQLWPNPARDVINLMVVADHPVTTYFRLYDSKGRLMKNQRGNLLVGSNQIKIGIANLASGIYTIAIQSDDGSIKKSVQVFTW